MSEEIAIVVEEEIEITDSQMEELVVEEVLVTIEADGGEETVLIETTDGVELLTVGEQGLAGPQGEDGEQGPPGEGVDKNYVHNQLIPSTTWTIIHNLDKYPSVTVVDSAGTWVIGGLRYIDSNSIELSFSAGFSGKAFLN